MTAKSGFKNIDRKLHLDSETANAFKETFRKPAFYASAILLGSIEEATRPAFALGAVISHVPEAIGFAASGIVKSAAQISNPDGQVITCISNVRLTGELTPQRPVGINNGVLY